MPEFHLLLPDQAESAVRQAIATVAMDCKILQRVEFAGGSWVAASYPAEGPLRYLVNFRINEARKSVDFRSANPMGEPAPAIPVFIRQVTPNEDAGEAVVEGALGHERGPTIHFFMPWYFLDPDAIAAGRVVPVRFAALALAAETLRETSFELSEGAAFEAYKQRVLEEEPDTDPSTITSVTVTLDELRGFIADEPDTAQFQVPFSKPEKLTSPFGATVWKLDELVLDADAGTLRLPIYLPAALLPDYDSAAELPVRGRLWILGFLE